jgi:hypothetical protein
MDDPTTYLVRDTEDVAIMLAGSVESAMTMARQYGVSIQVNMPGNIGIRVVSNIEQATSVVAMFPPSTPWCIVADGLTDKPTRDMLTSWFGRPKTMDKALGVETDGIAWRPDKYPVTG